MKANLYAGGSRITTTVVFGSLVISAIAAGSYPYMVLKMGLGIGFSMISLLLANMLIKQLLRRKSFDRFENNLVQTGVSAASSSAFLVVIICALEMMGYHFSAIQITLWITATGYLGVLFTVPMREQFLVHDELRFPDGTACAEMAIALDTEKEDTDGIKKSRSLTLMAVVSAAITWLTKGFPEWLRIIPGKTTLGSIPNLAFGMGWSPMLVGSGIIIGLRVCFSILIGCLLCWTVIAQWLMDSGTALAITERLADPEHLKACLDHYPKVAASKTFLKENADVAAFMKTHCKDMMAFAMGANYPTLVKWTMWPATAILVCAGLTAMALRWRSIIGAFKSLWESLHDPSQKSALSFKELAFGIVLSTATLMVVQYWILDVTPAVTLAGIVISFFLALIAVRAVGDTGINPVSVMGSFMQILMSVIAPGIATNMASSGTAAGAAACGGDMMHDLKTGYLLKANPRKQIFMQFLCIPIGAMCISVFYPMIRNFYGIGTPTEAHPDPLPAPTSVKWKAFAELLEQGWGSLPPYALEAFVIAGILGGLIAVFEWYCKDKINPERFNNAIWVPSPMGLGIAFLLPGVVSLPLAAGGIIGWIWYKASAEHHRMYAIPIAVGAAVAEAFLSGVVLPFIPMIFG